MIPDREYKVLVKCMTYNQRRYIEDAMNGFTIQQTDFPFVCLIMDDASTDGEQDVIKSYLEKHFDMTNAEYSEIPEAHIVVVSHKTNPNCTFAVYFLKENLYQTNKKEPLMSVWQEKCVYVAMCEGDDYWTDHLKLQAQTNILDENLDISLCFHNVKILMPNGEFVKDFVTKDVPGVSTINELAVGNYIHTPSVLYRASSVVSSRFKNMGKMIVGDYPLWLTCAQNGNIYKLNDIMAVYRYGIGIWSSHNYVYGYSQWITTLAKISTRLEGAPQQIMDKAIDDSISQLTNSYLSEINSIKNSWSYRLGRFLTWPLRKFRDLISAK